MHRMDKLFVGPLSFYHAPVSGSDPHAVDGSLALSLTRRARLGLAVRRRVVTELAELARP